MSEPKKILIIGHTNTMGGVETFIRNTTLYSDRNKIQYYFLIHGTNECLFQDEVNDFYGHDCFYFVPRFKSSPIRTIKALKRFYKSHHDFDFIHLQTGAASEVVYAYPYCKKYGMKLIVHSHNGGNLQSFFSHQVFIPLINNISDIKLACSHVAAEYMFGKKNSHSVEVIPVGIDTSKFRFCKESREYFRNYLKIEPNTLVIGVVGRFTEQKNQKFAISIYKKLLDRNPDALLVLKGEGELENGLREQIMDLGIEEKVRIIRRIDSMEDMYNGLDVLLMPSLFEGLPQVAVEAQCCGLPCVFSDNISKEVILTNTTRMLKLSEDIEKWADVIIQVNDTKVDRLKGYESVKNAGYDIYDTVKMLEQIYRG